MKIKYIYKIFFFTLIFCLAFNFLRILLVEKRYHAKKWEYIYDKNTNIEILFLGSSHSYTAFNINLIDDIMNTESFILGSAAQNIIQTYYNLSEVLKYKSPKLIVIDLNSLLTGKDVTSLGHYYGNLDGMKLSFNKYYSITSTLEKKYYTEAFIPLLRGHTNWKKIKNNNTKYLKQYFKNSSYVDKGYNEKDNLLIKKDFNEAIKSRIFNNDFYNIDEANLDYFIKIINLCNENNIKFILVKSPTLRKVDLNENIDNLLTDLSVKYKFNYYNIGYLFDELQLNHNDFYDLGHLSRTGSEKVSKYLAKLLIDNYANLLNISSNYNEALNNYEIINKEKRQNSLNISTLKIKEDSVDVKFIINTYNNKLQYAFYLYKDGEKIDDLSYSSLNYYSIKKPISPGIYRVKYYIKNNKINNQIDEKKSGYFKDFIVGDSE